MPGPIFIHFQTFSRKSNAAGNCVSQVIGEALRLPEYSQHVEDSKPPRIVLGNAAGFEKEHDDHVAERGTEVKRKNKTYRKAIRQDRHTLATAVASYPLTFEQIETGGDDAREHHKKWEEATVKWMREKYGDQLKVVLAHDDESHPHLHFWMLPDDLDARADTLHPGKVAKRIAEDIARTTGATDREAVKAGNDALKVAMREVLDDYQRDVGERLGMTRDGPKRRRLTRAQWKAEKQEAARLGEVLLRADSANEIIKEAEEKAVVVIKQADDLKAKNESVRVDFNKTAKNWFEKQKASLATQKDELDEMAKNLGVQVELVAAEKTTLDNEKTKFSTMLDRAADFLRLPGLPSAVRKAGAALFKVAGRPIPEVATSHGGNAIRRRIRLEKNESPSIEKPREESGFDDFGI